MVFNNINLAILLLRKLKHASNIIYFIISILFLNYSLVDNLLHFEVNMKPYEEVWYFIITQTLQTQICDFYIGRRFSRPLGLCRGPSIGLDRICIFGRFANRHWADLECQYWTDYKQCIFIIPSFGSYFIFQSPYSNSILIFQYIY